MTVTPSTPGPPVDPTRDGTGTPDQYPTPWRIVMRCDSCNAERFTLRYSPNHGAKFCDGCYERENAPVEGSSTDPDPARVAAYAEAILGEKESGTPVLMLPGRTYSESRRVRDAMAVADGEQARLRVACSEFEAAYVGEQEARVKAEEKVRAVKVLADSGINYVQRSLLRAALADMPAEDSDVQDLTEADMAIQAYAMETPVDALDLSPLYDADDPAEDGRWVHLTDGSHCDEQIPYGQRFSNRLTASDGTPWWCTTHQSGLRWVPAEVTPPADGSRLRPGCTCGGISACIVCQEADAADAEVTPPAEPADCAFDVGDPPEVCRCLLPRGHAGLHQCRHTRCGAEQNTANLPHNNPPHVCVDEDPNHWPRTKHHDYSGKFEWDQPEPPHTVVIP